MFFVFVVVGNIVVARVLLPPGTRIRALGPNAPMGGSRVISFFCTVLCWKYKKNDIKYPYLFWIIPSWVRYTKEKMFYLDRELNMSLLLVNPVWTFLNFFFTHCGILSSVLLHVAGFVSTWGLLLYYFCHWELSYDFLTQQNVGIF